MGIATLHCICHEELCKSHNRGHGWELTVGVASIGLEIIMEVNSDRSLQGGSPQGDDEGPHLSLQ